MSHQKLSQKVNKDIEAYTFDYSLDKGSNYVGAGLEYLDDVFDENKLGSLGEAENFNYGDGDVKIDLEENQISLYGDSRRVEQAYRVMTSPNWLSARLSMWSQKIGSSTELFG